jgi:hypothetical protein
MEIMEEKIVPVVDSPINPHKHTHTHTHMRTCKQTQTNTMNIWRTAHVYRILFQIRENCTEILKGDTR